MKLRFNTTFCDIQQKCLKIWPFLSTRQFSVILFAVRLFRFSHVVILVIVFAGIALAQTSEAKIVNIPTYALPPEAVTAGIDGKVVLVITVNKEGKIDRAKVVAGPTWPCGSSPKQELEKVREGIIDAVKRSTFTPAMKEGKPQAVDRYLTLTIRNPPKKTSDSDKDLPTGETAKGDSPTINGAVINGKAIRLPKPEYPAEARSLGAAGTVEVEVLIDETGNVIHAEAKNGNPLLFNTTRVAACSAKFSPTRLNGQPVKVSGIITYNFVP